jgi:hypothetical protein
MKPADSELDLTLAVMCALLNPGECVPHHVIAEITGMSRFYSRFIEQRALEKIRRMLPMRELQ